MTPVGRPRASSATCAPGVPLRDRGAVTAEFAVALPAVVVVLLLALGTAGAAVAQVRCVEAARAGARAASLGEDLAAVARGVTSIVGADAAVEVERSGPWVVVTVKRRVAVAPWGALVAQGRASAWVEPGVAVPISGDSDA